MNRALNVLIVICIVLAASAVHAQSVSWNYAEGGYWNVDPDNTSSENGWFLGGQFEVGKKVRFHFFGEFGDAGPYNQWQLGGGWHGLLGKRADLFADGAFFDADVQDGFKVRFGVRWMVLKRLELNGFLAWTDLDFGSNSSAAVNGIFDFTKRFGVGAGYEWGNKTSTARAFVRFNFGARG
jgi:hypothetical protein